MTRGSYLCPYPCLLNHSVSSFPTSAFTVYSYYYPTKMAREVWFTEYHSGYTGKIMLKNEDVYYNGHLEQWATLDFSDDNFRLVINWHRDDDEHIYELIDKYTSLYELKTRQGKTIPNGRNISRPLLIRYPTWDIAKFSKLGRPAKISWK